MGVLVQVLQAGIQSCLLATETWLPQRWARTLGPHSCLWAAVGAGCVAATCGPTELLKRAQALTKPAVP